jgi:hypothetical protein
MYLVTKGMESHGKLVPGSVYPCSHLGVFVCGETGGHKYSDRYDEAYRRNHVSSELMEM